MDAYIITGAAGFIGSNIVQALAQTGSHYLIAVDDLEKRDQFFNLLRAPVTDYYDKHELLSALSTNELNHLKIKAIFHQGACSDTMNHDAPFMMRNNYRYTVELFRWAQAKAIPFLYASSAAVYGASAVFKEERRYEAPLNIYGYSKFLFDEYMRHYLTYCKLTAPVVGFRYFNVYGFGEQHKGRMASVVLHHYRQYREKGFVELFGAYDGYAAGEQKRDFIAVEDVAKVNLFFLKNAKTGIYNLGTGLSRSFNDLAAATVNTLRTLSNKKSLSLAELVEQGLIRYVDFPDSLKGKYQSFTQADISLLRNAGYHEQFLSLEVGIDRYIRLNEQ